MHVIAASDVFGRIADDLGVFVNGVPFGNRLGRDLVPTGDRLERAVFARLKGRKCRDNVISFGEADGFHVNAL